MMKYMKIICLTIVFLLLMTVTAYASEPYRGYTYDSFGNSVPAPNGYEPDKIITGIMLEIGAFKNPEDIFVDDATQTVYVLDSGNNRIVVLDRNLECTGIIDKYYDNGNEMKFGVLTGIFVVPSAGLFLAEKDESKILYIDFNGNLVRTYTKPESDQYRDDRFLPVKVLVDSALNVYAICSGVFEGAVVFDNQGKFSGYYGSTLVKPNLQIMAASFWKKMMTEEQKDTMRRYVPIEYSNFSIDKNDFIYTVTLTNELSNTSIRKLNPKGVNILKPKNNLLRPYVFGDMETYTFKGKQVVTQFVDISVDEEGFINALDITRGKIFQYDAEGNLLFAFGQLGSKKGTFKQTTAIDTLEDKILVLDKQKNSITTFKLTEFGKNVHNAIELYNKGMYDQAQGPWREVLKRDNNYELAYIGLGAASLNLYQYKDAMKYFKLGKDRLNYSKAFRQYRIDYVRGHFSGIALYIFLLIIAVILIRRRKRIFAYISKGRKGNGLQDIPKRNEPLPAIKMKEYKYLTYIAAHPINGYEDLTYYKAGSITISLFILVMWIFSAITSRQLTGFPLNFNDTSKLNIFFILAQTVLLFVLWTVSNWSFCTLMDGKGTFRQIWISSAYALVPSVIFSVIATVVSNFLTNDEQMFQVMLIVVGNAWSALLIVSAMSTIHDYSFGKTILSIMLTLFGILFIYFLIVLSFSLYHQVISLFKIIYNEIMFRI